MKQTCHIPNPTFVYEPQEVNNNQTVRRNCSPSQLEGITTPEKNSACCDGCGSHPADGPLALLKREESADLCRNAGLADLVQFLTQSSTSLEELPPVLPRSSISSAPAGRE